MVGLHVNHLAVFLAAVAAWLAGAVWYGALGSRWLAALGKAREQMSGSKAPFVIAFAGALVMSFALACVAALAAGGRPDLATAVVAAFLVWAGFIATTTTVNNAFADRPFALTLIDAGHWLLALVAAGAVIGLFG